MRVESNFDGYRLDRYLKARIARLSRTRIQAIIDGGQLLGAAGIPIRRMARRVRAGEELVLLRPTQVEPAVTMDYRELYRDQSLLVIDKPSGLPVHPSARYLLHTLTALMRDRLGEGHGWQLAHRLDRETSGVMLLGRKRGQHSDAPPDGSDEQTSGILQRAFQSRDVRKEYLAICRGALTDRASIDAPLALDPASAIRLKMGVVKVEDGGLEARTDVEPLASGAFRDEPITLVRCLPRTGRQHQIRVHLALLGFPILGDKLYGVDEHVFLDLADGRTSMADVELRLGIGRQALHAHRIGLSHPRSGERVTFTAPWPEELAQILALPTAFAQSDPPEL